MMPALAEAKGSAKRRKRTGPVRVGFLIDRLSRAGTETQLLALIRSLDRSRVLPFLCLLDGEDELSRSLEPTDCPVLRLGVRSLFGSAAMVGAARVKHFWRRNRIDVVQTYFLDSTYFGVPLARLCGVRRVIRVRNNLGYWLTGKHRRLGRWMGRLADVTLTNSPDGREALVTAEGLHPEKIAVLENGVDLDRFPSGREPFSDSERVRVGAVANLRPVKNIDGLIRAAAVLRDEFAKLLFEVAGDGEQRMELEALIQQHRLGDRFHLLGAVADVPGFLVRQDVAVLCSHSEGMSNALLEYMASGRAIIATDAGANARLIIEGLHGRIVPPGKDESLTTALAEMIRAPQAARRMAAAARQRAEAEYSRAAMVRRFEDFYERLLS
jgi:glycosyltransferase involved in cell wall biosynthesis